MISATPPPSIEVSLFGAVDAPSTSAKAKENLEKLETFLEGLSGRPGRRVAEREVRIRCPAGGELRLRRQMVDVVSSSSSSSSSPACSSPASAFDLSSAATEWTLTQAGPPLRGRGAATLAALARPVTGVVTPSAGAGGGGGVGGAGDLYASSSLSVLAPCSSGAGVEACVAGRHAPAFFASAGFALDFSSPSSGDGGGGGGGGGGGEVFRTGRRYRLFRSGGVGGGGGAAGGAAGGQGASAAAAASTRTSGPAETEQLSKGGGAGPGGSGGSGGVLVTVSLTESFSPLLPGESLSSALSPGAAGAEGAAAADAAALGAAAACSSFVPFARSKGAAAETAEASPPPLEPVAPRFPGLVLVSVTAVASESDYAAAAAQVGALAEVLRPWVELRKQ